MKRLPIVLPVLFLIACGGDRHSGLETALAKIEAEGLMRHIEVLASDEFEGRAPATQGEELTVAYLTGQFRQLGLEPGNPDGSYIQQVPLVGITSKTTAELRVGGKLLALEPRKDYVAVSRRMTPSVEVKASDIVFVGYGVVAPEYGWDDYKGLDVKGKTLLMLVNDPAVPAADDPTKLDDAYFKGRAMTYYGRWTYKYEIATEKGAAAAIIIHETGPAGYPFEVVSGSWGRENFETARQDRNMGRVPVESWITEGKARELLAAAGQDFDALKRAAVSKDFRPVALPANASFSVKTQLREVTSANVVGLLPGAEIPDEYVIYTSHWDHLGRDETLEGDQTFNGAIDNASGVASLLELAEAFAALEPRPKRSLLFLAVTAEEKGLLGAKYYAENPLYPLEKTLANINIDGVNQWGRTGDIVVVGLGNSTLDDLVRTVAAKQDRTVEPDAEPEKGFFYRSDHFELAKQGVPALYTDNGTRYIGKPEGYGQQKRDEYTAKDYHKVSDEVKPDWDLAGAVEDTRLLFEVGLLVANADRYPEWKPGAEFKARREAMLQVTGR